MRRVLVRLAVFGLALAALGSSPAPRVELIGRFDARDPSGPACGWPGCRIVARFEGPRVDVRLTENVEPWMTGGPSEWDVAIDGAPPSKLTLQEGTRTYPLASGLAAGAHVVELYKRSEAQNGITRFLGFELAGGHLLPPPPRAERRIEVAGDSSAAGFGVEGVGHGPKCPGPNHGARWQNFRRSFGARLGEALGAEVQGSVYSGKGLVRNIWRPDKETFPTVFARAVPTDPESTWDFGAWVPDVVVVMLGGNDFSVGQPTDDGPTSAGDFTSVYTSFVASLRDHYPAAHVFLSTSATVSDDNPPARHARTLILRSVADVLDRRHAAGDMHVYAWTPTPATASELTGCDGHGSPELHQRLADELEPLVREKTGW